MGKFILLLEAEKFFNLFTTIKINPEWINRWTSNTDNRTGDGAQWQSIPVSDFDFEVSHNE
jgi:hypothetical protein